MHKRRLIFFVLFLALVASVTRSEAGTVDWLPFGPDGGDARAFAADPHDSRHLYLGTANGWIYESHNGGMQWKRLARVAKRDNLVLDNIVFDPAVPGKILAGAWALGSTDGGLFVSKDSGISWSSVPELQGQSVLALVGAPSDPNTFVAGTLKGVYKSVDGGASWKLISPEGSQEIHEVESVAIDPKNPKIIYAGTWHLPWKTTDDGAHWSNIKEGVIDDSDVFSIIIDPKEPSVVYASACSGIYKSETAGARFQKIQGIPATARRTRVLMQDPKNLNIVFAGTTEGLYRTTDSGKTWVRTTGPELIVNDVFINPEDTNRVMLATDRGGVLISSDGGASFRSSNEGFSARQVISYVDDFRHNGTIYVGVVNDKEWGGAFVSTDGGLTWVQKSAGLERHDVLSLGQTSDGTILAGTRHGIYRLNGEVWGKVSRVSLSAPTTVAAAAPSAAKKGSARRTTVAKSAPKSFAEFDGTVFAFTRDGDQIFAATSEGVLKSVDAGQSWTLAPSPQGHVWYTIASSRSAIVATSLTTATISTNNGRTWATLAPPAELTQITSVAVDDLGGIWIGGREGVFLSENKGLSWHSVPGLTVRGINSLFYDGKGERVLVTANSPTTIAYSVHLPDRKVSYWNTGWNLRLVRPVGNHLVAATMFDGVVIQPEMVNSAEVAMH